MKTVAIALIMISLVVIGCGNNDGSNNVHGDGAPEPQCTTRGDVLESECIAEDLVLFCEPFLCGVEVNGLGIDFLVPPETDCTAPDCQTMECPSGGLYMNLTINENGTLVGTVPTIVGESEMICFDF